MLGFDINTRKHIVFNGSKSNKDLDNATLSDVEKFTNYSSKILKYNNAFASIGGYLEKRVIYKNTKHFENSDRNIHLGLDIFMVAETPIFVPIDAEIHSFSNNVGNGNYGPTIILKHNIEENIFYTLYGHLSLQSLENKKIGQFLPKGTEFCAIGNYPENGNWPPHLHFQIIIDIQDNYGDYIGVCAAKDLKFYSKNCPNPNLILQSKLL